MEIKDIIKNRRLEMGLTMKELADKVGVSEGTVSRWESGNIANMRRDKIALLSEILGVPLSVLMGWETDADRFASFAKKFNESNPKLLTGKEKALLKKYRKLNDENKTKVDSYTDQVLKLQEAEDDILLQAAHREKEFDKDAHEHDMEIIKDL